MSKSFKELRTKEQPIKISVVQLTQDEIGILLELVKNSNFNGNMIDTLYHLTAKLQKEYLKGQ